MRYGGRDFGGCGGRGHGNRCLHIVARLATPLKYMLQKTWLSTKLLSWKGKFEDEGNVSLTRTEYNNLAILLEKNAVDNKHATNMVRGESSHCCFAGTCMSYSEIHSFMPLFIVPNFTHNNCIECLVFNNFFLIF